MAEWVEIQVARGLARVTLSRPELHNAFNEVVIENLTEAFRVVGGREDVRVVVLAGEGKSFCAGADVQWMKRMLGFSIKENEADASTMCDMLTAIRECPKPVIARVHGAAIGGGVGLTAACDLAAATANATFCLSEVKLGIVPAVISPFVMEKIGAGAMRRYALTAERFDAAAARRIGLVAEVFDSADEMDAWIETVAGWLMKNGPAAIAVCKRLLREVHEADGNGARRLTIKTIAERRVSAEGQEGLTAFLEKREPRWGVS